VLTLPLVLVVGEFLTIPKILLYGIKRRAEGLG
jgi:hypothetical protein